MFRAGAGLVGIDTTLSTRWACRHRRVCPFSAFHGQEQKNELSFAAGKAAKTFAQSVARLAKGGQAFFV
jgi:hypothetical protein